MSELYGLFEFLQGIGLLALVIMLPIFIIGGTIGHFSYRDPKKTHKYKIKATKISSHPEYQRAFKKASELQQVFLDAKEIDDGYFSIQPFPILRESEDILDYNGKGYLFFAKYYEEPFILMEVEKYLEACANGNSAMREAYHNSLGTHLFGSLENMQRVERITGYDFDGILNYFRRGKEWKCNSYECALDLPLYCGEFFYNKQTLYVLSDELEEIRSNKKNAQQKEKRTTHNSAAQGKDASKSTQSRTKHTKFEPYIMRYLRHLRK